VTAALGALLYGSMGRGEDVDVEPLSEVPSGWVYLRQSSIDAWEAYYHDAESGAYLYFMASKEGQTRFWRRRANSDRSDAFSKGRVGAVRYELVILKDGRERRESMLKKITGSTTSDPWMEEILPPPNAREFVFSFEAPREGVWNFVADVCNEAQEARVRDLLLGKPRFNFAESAPRSVPRGAATRAAYESLDEGVTFGEVIEKLGPPNSPSRTRCDGFTIHYYIEPNKDGFAGAKLDLRFSREQRLVKKDLQTLEQDR
jgi:hypothetical protein